MSKEANDHMVRWQKPVSQRKVIKQKMYKEPSSWTFISSSWSFEKINFYWWSLVVNNILYSNPHWGYYLEEYTPNIFSGHIMVECVPQKWFCLQQSNVCSCNLKSSACTDNRNPRSIFIFFQISPIVVHYHIPLDKTGSHKYQ